MAKVSEINDSGFLTGNECPGVSNLNSPFPNPCLQFPRNSVTIFIFKAFVYAETGITTDKKSVGIARKHVRQAEGARFARSAQHRPAGSPEIRRPGALERTLTKRRHTFGKSYMQVRTNWCAKQVLGDSFRIRVTVDAPGHALSFHFRKPFFRAFYL
ncbi:MAG: hypothetical protein LBR60_04325 [Fibrobacter sp.]|nr:hypothetical protein [Fibrobacter sp.]